jgi:hypothetical protein
MTHRPSFIVHRLPSRIPVLKPRYLTLFCAIAILLAACDGAVPPTPVQPRVLDPNPTPTSGKSVESTVTLDLPASMPTAGPTPSGTIVDVAAATPPPTPNENASTPTPVTAVSTGDALTALQALASLKSKALAWQTDARLGMLANVRPGQGKAMLASALGDPDVFEPTPGGKGRNWTLLAASPSTRGVVAFSMDGTQTDLVSEGDLTGVALDKFIAEMAVLNLASLNPNTLVDSDALFAKTGQRGQGDNFSMALFVPDGLGSPPPLSYQLFSTDPNQQTFVFFDARTGEVLLDSSNP